MGKTYSSVTELVRETAQDEQFAESLEARIKGRQIVKDLAIRRALKGLSQKDVAAKLSCSQGRVSKLEASPDVELRMGDLAAYANVLGLRLHIVLETQKKTPVHRVKQYAFRIKEELDQLAGLAKKDHSIARGVSNFFGEAFFNLVKMLQDSAERLPCNSEDGTPYISFEINEDIEEDAPGGPEGPKHESASLEQDAKPARA